MISLSNFMPGIGAAQLTQNAAGKSGTSTGQTDISSIFSEFVNNLSGSEDTQANQNQDGLPQNQDPDSYAQEYADEKGISLDEAKEELESKYGKPQEPNKNFSAQA